MSQTESCAQPPSYNERWWQQHGHMHADHFCVEELYQRFRTRQAAEASDGNRRLPAPPASSMHNLEVALYWGTQYRLDQDAGKPLSGHERSVLALTEEVHRLRGIIQRWENCCTGRHGSQSPCVDAAAPQTAHP